MNTKALEGIRNCVFKYKFPMLILLALFLSISIFAGTPNFVRPITGLMTIAIGCVLGTVNV